MIYFLVVLAVLVFLILLYSLVLVRPKKYKNLNQNLLCNYAHRGLHGAEIPENSMAAFERAVEKGYGIELDVQLSKDGVVTVFHDYTLNRMTGIDKKLCELDPEELQRLTLNGTNQTIPTFKQVLELVNGKVPLLVELKGENLDTALCEKVAELLYEYKGDYCIESFNPLLIKAIKKYLPNAFCGQLFTNVCRDKKKYSVLNIVLTFMAFNFLAKPNFIAFNQKDRNSIPVILTTKLYKAPKFVWTITNKNDFDKALENQECAIFERI
jgi:glycerophosphoryl diester phosphodiesterase